MKVIEPRAEGVLGSSFQRAPRAACSQARRIVAEGLPRLLRAVADVTRPSALMVTRTSTTTLFWSSTEGLGHPLKVRPATLPETPTPVPPAPLEPDLPDSAPLWGENLPASLDVTFFFSSSVFEGSVVLTGFSFFVDIFLGSAGAGLGFLPGTTSLVFSDSACSGVPLMTGAASSCATASGSPRSRIISGSIKSSSSMVSGAISGVELAASNDRSKCNPPNQRKRSSSRVTMNVTAAAMYLSWRLFTVIRLYLGIQRLNFCIMSNSLNQWSGHEWRGPCGCFCGRRGRAHGPPCRSRPQNRHKGLRHEWNRPFVWQRVRSRAGRTAMAWAHSAHRWSRCGRPQGISWTQHRCIPL